MQTLFALVFVLAAVEYLSQGGVREAVTFQLWSYLETTCCMRAELQQRRTTQPTGTQIGNEYLLYTNWRGTTCARCVYRLLSIARSDSIRLQCTRGKSQNDSRKASRKSESRTPRVLYSHGGQQAWRPAVSLENPPTVACCISRDSRSFATCTSTFRNLYWAEDLGATKPS